MFRRRPGFLADQEGAALVEGAIFFPFFAALAFGTFEFSNMFFAHHLMTTGVRDAARYLARLDDPESATNQARAQNLAATGQIAAGGVQRISWWAPTDVQFEYDRFAAVDATTGVRQYRGSSEILVVRVRTTVAYPGLQLFKVPGIGAMQVRASHEERVVRE